MTYWILLTTTIYSGEKLANIALIIAGGTGERVIPHSVPKQFIPINGEPVLAWTISAFQVHPNIDAIYVVILRGWEQCVLQYKQKYNFTKLNEVVSGGDTGFQSIRNGLNAIAKNHNNDDIVLIHDGVRPMVSQKIITDNIATVQQYGNAITAIPCAEAVLQTSDNIKSNTSIPRAPLRRTQTPQGFYLGDILAAHRHADEKGITNSVASCTLFTELGLPVFLSTGSEQNIKLTTYEDIELLELLLSRHRNEQLSTQRISDCIQKHR